MFWRHFRTFAWLRWRLRRNQLRRQKLGGVILLGLLTVVGVFAAVGAFVGMFFVGRYGLENADPLVHLLVWDGIVVSFLFFWSIGLLNELQRAEALSLD